MMNYKEMKGEFRSFANSNYGKANALLTAGAGRDEVFSSLADRDIRLFSFMGQMTDEGDIPPAPHTTTFHEQALRFLYSIDRHKDDLGNPHEDAIAKALVISASRNLADAEQFFRYSFGVLRTQAKEGVKQ